MRRRVLAAVCLTGTFAANAAVFAQTVAGVTPKPGFDTAFITDDFAAALVVHPQRIFRRPVVKATFAEIERVAGKTIAEQPFRELMESTGIDPRKIRQMVMLFGNATDVRETVMGRPAFILRMSEAIDQKKILALWTMTTKTLEPLTDSAGRITGSRTVAVKKVAPDKRSHLGKTYYHSQEVSFFFPDDKTLVAASEPIVRKMLAAKHAKAAFTSRLAEIGNRHDGLLLIDVRRMRPLLAKRPKDELPLPIAVVLPHAGKIKLAQVTGDLSGKTLASVRFDATDKPAADALAKDIRERLLPLLKSAYKLRRDRIAADLADESRESWMKLIRFADGLVDSLAVEQNGTAVAVTLPPPKDLAALPKRLGPAIQSMRLAAERSKQKNKLKQIGIAFHNYHDAHSRMPTHASDGVSGKIGLSWRVHLLPYLEQGELYKKFRLDEPWDSKHNKTLIGKMPAIFKTSGVTAKGKTSMHVFIGSNTPFGPAVGTRLRDVTDGLSNTFMAIVAGSDKADVWTKPGGIPFEKKDTWKPLGKIPKSGFPALMMDGSVTQISPTLSIIVLRNLIQHNDGNPLGEF